MVLSTQNRMADNGSSCRGRRLIEDRAMLLLDVGFVKTNLWNGDRLLRSRVALGVEILPGCFLPFSRTIKNRKAHVSVNRTDVYVIDGWKD
jgi:hypothetical protein